MVRRPIKLFLCGDVMTGRGIDQLLPSPNSPELREVWVRDARDYIQLAERINGPIRRPVHASYIWGDALDELEQFAPDVRIINLETSVTTSASYSPGKAIHYRMHPANVACLTTARIDVCTLANNHVLDFGDDGLLDTLDTLHGAGIRTAGAGRDVFEAQRPAIVELPEARRVAVFSLASETSGVPAEWCATEDRAGVDLIPDLSDAVADHVLERVAQLTTGGDLSIASIHWGGNWGYDVPRSFVHFAHRLLDGGFALVHGHSSHHPKPIEVYKNKLVLYGCGDFLSDYEGITGHEQFGVGLGLMYFATVYVDSGELLELRMVPMRMRRMQATRASRSDAEWLRDTLARASQSFGSCIDLAASGTANATDLLLHARADR